MSMTLAFLSEVFRLCNEIFDDVTIQRRKNSGPANIVDLNEAGFSQNLNMSVHTTIIHFQVASNRGYVQGFGAVHQHQQDTQSNWVPQGSKHC